MPYILDINPAANHYINKLSARDRSLIFDRMDEQLSYQPDVETLNRKPLRPDFKYPTASDYWELRVNDYRVFYLVQATEQRVVVLHVAKKERNMLRIGGELIEASNIVAWLYEH